MKKLKELTLSFDKDEAILLLGSTLLVVVYLYRGGDDWFAEMAGASLGDNAHFDYYRHLYKHIAALVLFGVIPAIAFGKGLGRKLKDNGFCAGDVAFGLKFLAGGIIILPVFLYFNSGSEAMMAEYPLTKLAGKSVAWFILWEFTYLIYYIGFESFFRGSLFFPLVDKYGAWPAILITTMFSTFQHIGKPEAETISVIAAGVIFGAVAYRIRSFLYVLILHWYIGILTDGFSLLHIAAQKSTG